MCTVNPWVHLKVGEGIVSSTPQLRSYLPNPPSSLLSPGNVLLNNDLHSSRKLHKTPEYKPRILPVTTACVCIYREVGKEKGLFCLQSHQANGLTDLSALKIVAPDTYLFVRRKNQEKRGLKFEILTSSTRVPPSDVGGIRRFYALLLKFT